MKTSQWTMQEYDFLYKNYNTKGADFVAEHLDRSVSSVNSKAEKMGLNGPCDFKKYELDLASSYGKTLGTALTFLLPKRTSGEVLELIECVK